MSLRNSGRLSQFQQLAGPMCGLPEDALPGHYSGAMSVWALQFSALLFPLIWDLYNSLIAKVLHYLEKTDIHFSSTTLQLFLNYIWERFQHRLPSLPNSLVNQFMHFRWLDLSVNFQQPFAQTISSPARDTLRYLKTDSWYIKPESRQKYRCRHPYAPEDSCRIHSPQNSLCSLHCPVECRAV